MRKRIAVFAGGWGDEYLKQVMTGIMWAAKKENIDVFLFVNFSVRTDVYSANTGEFNIFTLPDLRDFDGTILMPNSFNAQAEYELFAERLKEIPIPAISVEYDFEGLSSVFSDNYTGMKELALHIIKEHGAKELVYIGGPKDHMESNERLQAVLDAAAENHLAVSDENIMYGDWSKNPAKSMVEKWLQEHGKLPDAFLCANDITALGVCEWLCEHGYEVPRDVIVTGYDCIREAQEYFPRITSVNHEWGRMGELAFQCLYDRMNGKQDVGNAVMHTHFVPGESCGCEPEYKRTSLSGEPVRNMTQTKMDWMKVDSHFRHIYLAVRRVDNATELGYSLSYLFQREHQIEGESFGIYLDPAFFNIEENDENLRKVGYPQEMDAVCSLFEGKLLPHERKSLGAALFEKAAQSEKPELYVLLPIYSEERTYGFAMLTGSECFAEEKQLYIWTRHMNQYLEQVRRNIQIADLNRKLAELSVTDALTGVYNRAGCERIAYPMLREWQSKGGTGVIMLVDIDRMKTINDKFGHASGDQALCTVADVLKSVLPLDWIISRFGGDEFFIGGKASEEDLKLSAIEERLMDRLAKEVIRRQIKFRLSISVGSVILPPDGETNVEKILQMADENMYSVKRRHHREMDEESASSQ